MADLAGLPFVGSRRVQQLLPAIADHSPYLWQGIANNPDDIARILDAEPQACVDALLADLLASSNETEADLMRRLRRTKRSVALAVAVADLDASVSYGRVLEMLSRAADAYIATALAYLLRAAHAAGRLDVDPAYPEQGCGLVVLGLGKLGGCELNYSSDVDLIVLLDPHSPALVDPDTAKTLLVRLVRDLVRILQQSTADGYVLRVDLRLRPEPSASAVAISTEAALLYYEKFGQSWERAALIKARPVAGDREVGAAFLAELRPFIWRRYLDFAAIAEIHAMKRRIYAAKGGGEIAIAGHNVKLGRGGIRDIEFFVQAQQLIFGGKQPTLRGAQTLPMLEHLRELGWIGGKACDDLSRAYLFLRRVEHRLQMIADAQTHTVPASPADLERFARFCGFRTAARFSNALRHHLQRVARHYDGLFAQAADHVETDADLDFHGAVVDPETLRTLGDLGFRRPDAAAETVHEWQAGLRPALRPARTREILADLVPKLLVTLSRTADPDAALAGFDRSLSRMPAAGELFAILGTNAALRTLYGDILGSAPVLAQAVTSYPHLLDIAIDPTASVCLDEDEMEARVAAALAHLTETEDVLDAVRDYQHAEHFLIGVRLLSGTLPPDEAARAYTALAVGITRALLLNVRQRLEADHGIVPGARMVLVAMGKLGSREMTAASDLDLVLIYELDAGHSETTGRKPIPAATFFARLTQRLVSALSLPTRRGRLYEVDMRLRPSGRQGPLATQFSAFADYQRTAAQTWEHMALTRARVIAGDADLGTRVAAEVERILRTVLRPRLREDIADMRTLMRRERPAGEAWDLKLAPGGLVDLEFIAQYLALREAAGQPDVLSPSTREILARATASGVLPDGAALVGAHRLLSHTTQMMRFALPPEQSPEDAGPGFQRRMADATGASDFPALKGELEKTLSRVGAAFAALIERDLA